MRKSVFEFDARRAAQIAAKHVGDVVASLPRRPLHEIPLSEIMKTTSNILKCHPDFVKVRISRWEITPVPKGRSKRPLYSYYEIGHKLIVARIISELNAEGELPAHHEARFKEALGQLYCNPPKQMIRRSIKAWDKLVNLLGVEKADMLMKRTLELGAKYAKEENMFKKTKSTVELKELGVADMFANPANRIGGTWKTMIEIGKPKFKATEVYRQILVREEKQANTMNYAWK